jgi:hypothetical protein
MRSKRSRGAGDRNRTRNLLFTKQLLCQLSYAGILSEGYCKASLRRPNSLPRPPPLFTIASAKFRTSVH